MRYIYKFTQTKDIDLSKQTHDNAALKLQISPILFDPKEKPFKESFPVFGLLG